MSAGAGGVVAGVVVAGDVVAGVVEPSVGVVEPRASPAAGFFLATFFFGGSFVPTRTSEGSPT